ncbi:large-conductance mechanosensitive channel [Phlyctochytrium arcticum]|nr:large-conductance mechanosensitive channel [Phlyctochytrium arcticum]
MPASSSTSSAGSNSDGGTDRQQQNGSGPASHSWTSRLSRLHQHASRRVEPSPPHSGIPVDSSSSEGALFSLEKLIKETKKGTEAAHGVWAGFKRFLNRGNVVDMAVGIVMGTAFTSVVNSLVNDMFLPFISLATPTQLSDQFILLRCPRGREGPVPCNRTSYTTIQEAKSAGAVTWNWGNFIQIIINFIIVSLAVFFIVKLYAHAFRKPKPAPPVTKECPLCTKDVPIRAKRCPECCADMPTPGEEASSNPNQVEPSPQMQEKSKVR